MSELKKFTNITENNVKTLGVQALADRPNATGMYGNSGLSSTDLKLWFDKLAKFLASKINEIQDTLAKDDIAQYIKLALDEYDITHLQDLIDAILDGSFADKVLRVYPSENAEKAVTLKEAFTIVNQKIADEIEDVYKAIADARKLVTDLGYGYTDADVRYVEDGGVTSADVEVVDDNGSRRLIFTFHNFGKGLAEIALALPLVEGSGENSIEQSEGDNQAITERSISLGEKNIAGAKGYYFTEIFYGSETESSQIKISTVQPKDLGLYISPEALSANPLFETPSYAVGDVFSLICNDHFALFGTITNINNDIITFEGDVEVFKSGLASQISQGHAMVDGDYYRNLVPEYDDYTLCVLTKPQQGVIEICKVAFAFGIGNISAGRYGMTGGIGNVVCDSAGAVFGMVNTVGYSGFAGGYGNYAPYKYDFVGGIGNKITAESAAAFCANNTVSGKYGFVAGHEVTVEGEAAFGCGGRARMKASDGSWVYYYPKASGNFSFVQNVGNEANATAATATGKATKAEAEASTTMGTLTHATPNAPRSLAGGYGSETDAADTVAFGQYCKTTTRGQAAFGKYNEENPDALFIVGNGTSDTARSNAFEVLKSGHIKVSEKHYGLTDLTASESALSTGVQYLVYE